MSVQVSYPGVYIDEVTSAGAISGVGTSTAAFLGTIKYGRRSEAVRITSWDGFLREFWRPQEMPADTDFLWYSVKGFFENGGKNCFVINVSDATPDSKILLDRLGSPENVLNTTGSAKPTIRLFARTPGVSSGLGVKVQNDSLVTAGIFVKPVSTGVTAVAGGRDIYVTPSSEAIKFHKGDVIKISKGTVDDTSTIVGIDASTGKITTATNIINGYPNTGTAATLKLADLLQGVSSFRAENVKPLSVGSSVTITQGTGTTQRKLFCRVVAIRPEVISSSVTHYWVTVDSPVDIFKFSISDEINIVSNEFSITIQKNSLPLPPYPGLSMDPGHPNYFASVINNDPTGVVFAEPVEPPNTTIAPDNRPVEQTGFVGLDPGINESSLLPASAYVSALKLLDRVDDVNLVMAPGRSDDEVQLALIDHCSRMQDRIALLSADRSAPLFGASGAEGKRLAMDSFKGYAAFYYPWLLVTSLKSNGIKKIPVPPTGYVAGIIARTDAQRGVHKAPAGLDAAVNGVIGVAQGMSDDEQGILNQAGINVIRVFQSGGRPVVWGARTTAPNGSDWQYISTRRLFLFIEESVQESIRWAVFEPNNIALWQKLKRVINAFLRQQWRDGALYGETEDQAFYVRIDEDINSESERQLGRLNIEIGIKPAYPAEFIVVRIGIWQGGSQILEG